MLSRPIWGRLMQLCTSRCKTVTSPYKCRVDATTYFATSWIFVANATFCVTMHVFDANASLFGCVELHIDNCISVGERYPCESVRHTYTVTASCPVLDSPSTRFHRSATLVVRRWTYILLICSHTIRATSRRHGSARRYTRVV